MTCELSDVYHICIESVHDPLVFLGTLSEITLITEITPLDFGLGIIETPYEHIKLYIKIILKFFMKEL